jgi:2OG-Fe(II) oxygenase superfamily
MSTLPIVCTHYVKFGKCKYNQDCRYEHIDHVCPYYFMNGRCKNGQTCDKSHQYQVVKNEDNVKDVKDVKDSYESKTNGAYEDRKTNRRKPKNTECFTPSFEPSDMTVKFDSASYDSYPHSYQSRDVIVVSHLFDDMKENVYETLLNEIGDHNNNNNTWKLWHGDTHYIADDKLRYKEKCPTFMKIVDRLQTYFRMDIKATRLNWYSEPSEWKPYHFDAAAVDQDKAKVQNFTIGVSFGDTREASFQHAKTKTTVNFPLENGTTYGFGSQTNVEWRHGIPPTKNFQKGRISIIAWGWVDMGMGE